MCARYFLFIFILLAFSFSKKRFKESNPPGTVQFNDTLFIDKFELGNVHWREYLSYLSEVRKDENVLTRARPDTSVWNSAGYYHELSVIYMRHPGYNYYPVVGVSYDQVIEFCKWRTFIVNFGYYLQENKFKEFKEHLQDSFPIKVVYRLPTEKEWEMVASGKFEIKKYPYGYDTIYRKWKRKYWPIFNCNYPGETINDSALKRHSYTVAIESFYPNSSGCYNMIGNVAEMVLEKGIAKGGGFVHPLDTCKIPMQQIYTKPERWLGFRCVAIKIKKVFNSTLAQYQN
ncbi:MAG: hypothetical protein E6H07_06050 [Bacteroidetes bacterium]|nr:MAG: hypothetical protein E6H07_06050 [Bacteroidota bacterium]